MLVRDGRSGKSAAVTSANRLSVKASTVSELQTVSVDNEFAFLAENRFGIFTTLNGYVQILTNLDPSRLLVVDSVKIDVALIPGAATVFEFSRNPLVGTVTGDNDINPVNLNFGSGKRSLVRSTGWDGISGTGLGGITDVQLFGLQFLTQLKFIVPVDGIVLKESDTFGIKMNLGADTPVITTSITYYLIGEGV